jgi:hypothetical protein
LKKLSLYLLLACGSASADFINGNFSSGLNNWPTFNTNPGISVAGVANFDTTGNGASPAARFFVGTTSPGTAQGGGIRQTLNLTPGSYTISADIAAQLLSFEINQTDMGLFQLLLNDQVLSSYNFGTIQNLNVTTNIGWPRTDGLNGTKTDLESISNITGTVPPFEVAIRPLTLRATITEVFNIGQPGGDYNFKFQFLRDGINGSVAHYIDNIAITANGIPEPSSLALVGSCTIAALLWRRKRS